MTKETFKTAAGTSGATSTTSSGRSRALKRTLELGRGTWEGLDRLAEEMEAGARFGGVPGQASWRRLMGMLGEGLIVTRRVLCEKCQERHAVERINGEALCVACAGSRECPRCGREIVAPGEGQHSRWKAHVRRCKGGER